MRSGSGFTTEPLGGSTQLRKGMSIEIVIFARPSNVKLNATLHIGHLLSSPLLQVVSTTTSKTQDEVLPDRGWGTAQRQRKVALKRVQ